MDATKRKYHGQIEITDLVAKAVSNAQARRNQVLDSEEPLSLLSDEQAGSVTGGIVQDMSVCGGRPVIKGGLC